eukprot:UN05892
MFSKIVKANGEQPDELEKSIGEALLDLEVNNFETVSFSLKIQHRSTSNFSAKQMRLIPQECRKFQKKYPLHKIET